MMGAEYATRRARGAEHAMSELRRDSTTDGWVIIAPGRGKRPRQGRPELATAHALPLDATCPFCPGNESQLLAM
jgi:galactose-1-phosphate uridylyltransferase